MTDPTAPEENTPPPNMADELMPLPSEVSEEKPVTLVNPETGEKWDVSDAQSAQELLSDGYRTETKQEVMDGVAKSVIQSRPYVSSVAAFSNQALNQAALGIPQLIQEHAGSELEDMQAKAINKALAEEHPVLNIAGGVVGTAATLLTAPIGKVLGMFGDAAVNTAGKAAAIGGAKAVQAVNNAAVKTAIKLGAENAALNVPYRVGEEIVGDPNIANEGILAHGANFIENVGEDFGLGAGLGLGTSMFGKVLKTASGIVKNTVTPEWLREQSRMFQFKQAGAMKEQLNKLEKRMPYVSQAQQIQSVTDLIDEHADQLTQMLGPGAILKKMRAARAAIGRQLSEIRAIADSHLPQGAIGTDDLLNALDDVEKQYSKGTARLEPSFPQSAEEVQQWVQKYGPDTTKWPTQGASVTNPVTPPDLKAIQFVKELVRSKSVEKLQAMGMSAEEALAQVEAGNAPKFTLEELHNIRQAGKETLFNIEKANGIKTQGGKDAWNAIGQLMEGAIDNVAKQTKNKALEGAFSRVNTQFANLEVAIRDVFKPAARSAAGRNKIGLGAIAGAMLGPTEFAVMLAKQYLGNYAMYRTLGAAARVLETGTTQINSILSKLPEGPAWAKGFAGTPEMRKEAAKLGSVSVWSRYLGENKADPQKAFQEVQEDLANAQNNPDAVSTALDVAAPGMSDHAPNNFGMMGASTQRAIQYLRDMAPKPPPPLYAGAPSRPWKPSDNELSKYSRRLNAVFNPTSILTEMQAGTLTREAVEAVRTVYPNYFAAIQQQVMKTIAQAPPQKVYAMRQKLALLVETTEDPLMRAGKVQGLQAGFMQPKNTAKPRANSKIDEAGRYETPLDKALN